jgi:23S rRNA (adenine2503-C2)-methyltransferase
MQFSVHTTDAKKRDRLIPIRKLSLEELAQWGAEFFAAGDRKITLNFIVMAGYPIDPEVLRATFDPARFLIKLTPLNPTRSARAHSLRNLLEREDAPSVVRLASELRDAGFDTLVSVGAAEENLIGSNCGQYLSAADANS